MFCHRLPELALTYHEIYSVMFIREQLYWKCKRTWLHRVWRGYCTRFVYIYVVMALLTCAHGTLHAAILIDTHSLFAQSNGGIWNQASTVPVNNAVVDHFQYVEWYPNSLKGKKPCEAHHCVLRLFYFVCYYQQRPFRTSQKITALWSAWGQGTVPNQCVGPL